MAQRFIWIAVLYLIVGGTLGMYMGITQNFALMPVHAHVLLAGWLSLAMAGVVYRLYPAAAGTRLAAVHFWLHNLGLPAFMLGLGWMLAGSSHEPPVILAPGEAMFLAGLYCFAVNVWRKVRD